MIKDYFQFALAGLRVRKLRTLLTVIGIVIGIAALVGLISIGQGLQGTIQEQFEALGGNKIIIAPGGSTFGIPGAPQTAVTLDKTDLTVIEKTRGIEEVGGMIYKLGQVRYDDEQKQLFVSGMPQDDTKKIFSDIQTIEIIEGRELRKSDNNAAIIGILLYEGDYFKKEVNVRNTILIEGEEFKVVGVLGRIGNPTDDSQIIIPLETARTLYDEPNNVDFIMAQTSKGFKPSIVAESVKKELRKHRNVEEDEENFNVQTFEQLLSIFNEIFTVVNAILIGIAAISLIVGGIGIMNTMYTSVLQRTRDIGVMKAIGAQNKDIATIFLIESGLLGVAGGIIGILMGYGMGKLVEIAALQSGIAFSTELSAGLFFGALGFSFLVGTLAGIAPAISASKLNPVDSLRYE